jgi:hypothetical protein
VSQVVLRHWLGGDRFVAEAIGEVDAIVGLALDGTAVDLGSLAGAGGAEVVVAGILRSVVAIFADLPPGFYTVIAQHPWLWRKLQWNWRSWNDRAIILRQNIFA